MNDANAGTGSTARPGVGASPTPATDATEATRATSATPASADALALRLRRGATIVTGAAAVVAVFSSGVLYADLRSDRVTGVASAQGAPVPAAAPAPPASTTKKVIVQAPANLPEPARPVGAVRGAPPVQLSIPDLNINRRLVGLRVKPDRELEVPQSYDDIGWWSTGPVAGDPGAALMVGHLDSRDGPAVFYRLSSIKKGAAISVRRADGTTVRFAVTKVQTFAKNDFPDKLVYRTEGRSSLHLLTCGGSYDRSTGYRDNVVVFADKVKPKRPAKPKRSAKSKPAKPKDNKSKKADKATKKASNKGNADRSEEKKGRRGG